MNCYVRLAAAVTIGALVAPAFSSDTWPQFRGPTGDGISTALHPVEWSEEDGKNVDWKVQIEGFAWSQPIVWKGKAFVTTAVAADQPRPVQGDLSPGFSFFSVQGISRSLTGGEAADIQCIWKLVCLDLETGNRVWEKDVHSGRPALAIHRSNTYASGTPVTDGERVYVQVAMVGVWCFDMHGKEVWKKSLPNLKMQYGWGAGSSTLLHGDMLYLLCDNEQASYFVALDKHTGEERWHVERDELSNWSTPYLWRNKHRSELITCGGKKTQSYDPTSGDLIWELPADGRSATTAVGDSELLFVGSVTKSHGSRARLTAVKAGATGDLSEDSGQFIAWSLPKMAPELSSPLLSGGYLFTLRQQGGVLTCLDAATGKQQYRQRLPGAGGFTASPWLASKHVFCLDENGTTFVIEPAADFKLVRTNKLNGMFRSSAAPIDDGLLLRSADHLYRISASE